MADLTTGNHYLDSDSGAVFLSAGVKMETATLKPQEWVTNNKQQITYSDTFFIVVPCSASRNIILKPRQQHGRGEKENIKKKTELMR